MVAHPVVGHRKKKLRGLCLEDGGFDVPDM